MLFHLEERLIDDILYTAEYITYCVKGEITSLSLYIRIFVISSVPAATVVKNE